MRQHTFSVSLFRMAPPLVHSRHVAVHTLLAHRCATTRSMKIVARASSHDCCCCCKTAGLHLSSCPRGNEIHRTRRCWLQSNIGSCIAVKCTRREHRDGSIALYGRSTMRECKRSNGSDENTRKASRTSPPNETQELPKLEKNMQM
jgi:hypothetical protein